MKHPMIIKVTKIVISCLSLDACPVHNFLHYRPKRLAVLMRVYRTSIHAIFVKRLKSIQRKTRALGGNNDFIRTITYNEGCTLGGTVSSFLFVATFIAVGLPRCLKKHNNMLMNFLWGDNDHSRVMKKGSDKKRAPRGLKLERN